MDADFARQRIKGLNLYEAIKAAFFGDKSKKHKTLVDCFNYPKKGCGVVYENMKEEIIKNGGKIHTNCEVLGIKTIDKKASAIITNKGEFYGDIIISTAPFRDIVLSLEELDAEIKELASGLKFRNTILAYIEVNSKASGDSSSGNHLGHSACGDFSRSASPRFVKTRQRRSFFSNEPLSSISSLTSHNPENSLPSAREWERTPKDSKNPAIAHANSSILDEKSGLSSAGQGSYLVGNDRSPARRIADFSLKDEFANAPREKQTRIFKDNWIYVHSNNIATGRITNFANWTNDLRCGQKSEILCLEYWANDDEDLWNLSDESIIAIAKKDLLDSSLVKNPAHIKNASVKKIHKSYPIYERGYKANLHKIYDALSSFKDLYFIGRNGSFKYNNQDHSLLMGLLCADKILGKEVDLMGINTDYDYQESGEISEDSSDLSFSSDLKDSLDSKDFIESKRNNTNTKDKNENF